LFLKEQLNVIKVISTMFTILGVALLQIGKS
jgi:multidrug transporter EmrE-like cation transporter